MKVIRMALVARCALGTLVSMSANYSFSEAKPKPGSVPSNWHGTQTGAGTAHWSVEKDDSTPAKLNVLKQSGEATYPVCLKTDTSLRDGFVEVRFKPLSGQEDQAGGLIWRAQDANNYYVARTNALENNVTIYHTIKGRRVAFGNVDHPVGPRIWHTLRVDFQGKPVYRHI